MITAVNIITLSIDCTSRFKHASHLNTRLLSLMLLFGHLGITLAIVFSILYVLKKEKNVDYRILIIGIFLPDIIDKILGHLIFYESLSNGRIFSHTLLFLLAVTIMVIVTRAKLILLPVGIAFHLIEDRMWMDSKTLLWPFLGFEFPKVEIENYLYFIFHKLLTDPFIYTTETLGFAITLTFFIKFKMYRKENLISFIKGRANLPLSTTP